VSFYRFECPARLNADSVFIFKAFLFDFRPLSDGAEPKIFLKANFLLPAPFFFP